MSTDLDIHFFKGSENILKNETREEKEPLEKIKDSFGKVLDGKNLSFLLGCGCSSFIVDENEVGIPTMLQLAKEFYSVVLKEEGAAKLKDRLNLDVSAEKFKNNLEFFLGTLH